MLTGKQKRFLRHEAHHLNAIFQIGKDGLHETQIIGIDEALESRQGEKDNVEAVGAGDQGKRTYKGKNFRKLSTR